MALPPSSTLNSDDADSVNPRGGGTVRAVYHRGKWDLAQVEYFSILFFHSPLLRVRKLLHRLSGSLFFNSLFFYLRFTRL